MSNSILKQISVRRGIIIGLIILILCAVAFQLGRLSLTKSKSVTPVVYIDLVKVYSEFQYSKELNDKIENVINSRQYFLDSLKIEIESMVNGQGSSGSTGSTLQQSLVQNKQQEYVRKKQEFSEDNARMQEQFEASIWEKLNQHMNRFATERGYGLVLGANGTGNVMYGNANADITNEFIKYINDEEIATGSK